MEGIGMAIAGLPIVIVDACIALAGFYFFSLLMDLSGVSAMFRSENIYRRYKNALGSVFAFYLIFGTNLSMWVLDWIF